MSTIDELLTFCFDGPQPPFAVELEQWLRDSRRFRAFVMHHRVKIRAKLKGARDEAGLLDVLAELRTAALILRDERFTLEYERYTAARQRGPDFTATFRTHTLCNIEVRRIRSSELQAGNDNATANKLAAVICDKAGQMPPSIVNLLWLESGGDLSREDLTRAAAALRQRAEGKDDAFFRRCDYKDAAHFLKQFSRLSAVVLHQAGGCTLWPNLLARHKAPLEIIAAVQKLQSAQE